MSHIIHDILLYFTTALAQISQQNVLSLAEKKYFAK